jgi:pimeloyl-ACP methyl ester carboxylesterase
MAHLIQKHQGDKFLNTNLVLIPGGPGLGPNSFVFLLPLLSSYTVYYYYPTGTHPDDAKEDNYYEEQLKELVEALSTLENFYLIGHSFGGIIATEASLQLEMKTQGLFCIGSPFLEKSFEYAYQLYERYTTDHPETIELDLDSSDEEFKEWFIATSELYFKKENKELGRKIMEQEGMSYGAFLYATDDAHAREDLLEKIADKKFKKIFIAGGEDYLYTAKNLEVDAKKGKFQFEIIKDAGHFVHVDSSTELAAVLKKYLK